MDRLEWVLFKLKIQQKVIEFYLFIGAIYEGELMMARMQENIKLAEKLLAEKQKRLEQWQA